MRIAVVHSFYSSASPSGENVVVNEQVKALGAAGHDVQLFAKHTDVEASHRGFRLMSAARAANLPGPTPSSELTSFDPDIIHVHNLFPNWGTQWIKDFPGRVVVTLHNFRLLCAAATLWRDGHDCTECLDTNTWAALRHRCYRDSLLATMPLAIASRDRGGHQPLLQDAARLITLNEKARQVFDDLAPGRVAMVPNFVPSAQATADRRSGWLYVGRLTPEKGILELMRDFPADRQLVVMGDGPLADQVTKAVRSNITFLGPQPKDAVAARMATAEGLIIPSLWAEGIPTVALEALAAGTPLLVSAHCTSGPSLTSDGSGRVYDPSDPAGLSAAIDDIGTHQSAYSRAARAKHATEYSPQTWLARIDEVYQAVVHERTA